MVELPVILLSCNGRYPLEVHGESYREDAIRRLVAVHGPQQTAEDRCRCEIIVRLRREPTNAVDPNAVQVLSVAGELLGYIPRDLAPEYSEVLRAVEPHLQIQCRACAFGRLIGAGVWNYGIWLDVPEADELAEGLQAHMAGTLAV